MLCNFKIDGGIAKFECAHHIAVNLECMSFLSAVTDEVFIVDRSVSDHSAFLCVFG